GQLKEDYFGPQVPLSAEHRYVLAMFLESESLAASLKDRIAAGEDFTELAAELSLDGFTKEKSGDLGWQPRGILDGLLLSTVIDDAVFGASVEVLSQLLYDEEKGKELGYWLIEVLEKKGSPEEVEEVHVRVMLLASEEEALSIKDRIAAGEDFAQLAAEFSQLDGAGEDGGDLGFVTRGTRSATFEDYAFDPETELNTVSEPIADETMTSRGGYWLFMVSEIDPGRSLSDEDRELLLSSLLGDWVSSLVEDPQNEVVNYLDDEMRTFAVIRVIGG
ncbi:MAG: peptidylprolyl isomerase, partial [Dehalococcoidales bacterium]